MDNQERFQIKNKYLEEVKAKINQNNEEYSDDLYEFLFTHEGVFDHTMCGESYSIHDECLVLS